MKESTLSANRLRNCIDQKIIRFSVEDLLGCSLIEGHISFENALRFDIQKQVAWRIGDYDAYRIIYPTRRYAGHRILSTTNLLLKGESLGLSIRPKNGIKGLVIYPRDSVIVTVVKSLGVAIKVLRKSANQKNVIENECKAYRLLPEFVPHIVLSKSAVQSESFSYVVSRFIENSSPVIYGEWYAVLPIVLQALLLCYDREGFIRISVTEVVEQAASTLEKHREQSEFFNLCQSVIQDISDICLQFREAKLLTTFVHGDLTWDAIHRCGDTIKIIDWGNAGYKSVFYDLFIQEFYQANSKFWRTFLDAESYDYFSSYFFGAFDLFYHDLTTRTHTDFSLFDIKANITVSLLENAVDNFLRYRLVDEMEGIEFFHHIKKIKDNICVEY